MAVDPEVIKVAQSLRADVDIKVKASVIYMADKYAVISDSLDKTVDNLRKEIKGLIDEGKNVGPEWYRELHYYKTLQSQVYDKYGNYAYVASLYLDNSMVDMAQNGANMAQTLLQASAVGDYQFPKLANETIQALVSIMQDQAPLSNLLTGLGTTTWVAIQDELSSGLAKGLPIKQIAQRMSMAKNIGYQRSLVIARTEILRAHRTASQYYYQNTPSCKGFKRLADAKNGCMACIAKDGERFTSKQNFYDHPNGRCTMIPIVKGLREPEWDYAYNKFENLPKDEQIERMGIEFWHNWKDRKFNIKDLGSVTTNPIWGSSPKVTPLSQLVPNWRDLRNKRLGIGGYAPTPTQIPAPSFPSGKMPSPLASNLANKVTSGNFNVTPNPDTGYFDSRWVTFPDGSKALMKPSPANMSNWGLDTTTMSQREALAYQMSDALGINEVPVTVFDKNLDASFQQMVKNANPAANLIDYSKDPTQFGDGALLDMLLGNSDRHDYNWMIDKDGNIWFIDHGLTFGQSRATVAGQKANWEYHLNNTLDPGIDRKQWINNPWNSWGRNDPLPIKAGSLDNLKIMQKEFNLAMSGGDKAYWIKSMEATLTPDEIKRFGQRLTEVINDYNKYFKEF